MTLLDWLITPETSRLSAEELVPELAQRLIEAGVPVDRLHTTIRTLHPEIYVQSLRWTEGHLKRTLVPNTIVESQAYLASPLISLQKGADEILIDLNQGPHAYAICDELAESGHTGYAIFALRSSHDSYLSVATRHPNGFTSEQITTLRQCLTALRMVLEIISQRLITKTLLNTYLGKNAASRVLAGAFKRGGGDTLKAIIWFSDLRSFTSLVDKNPMPDVLETLDTYFECAAAPVQRHGGEILKFMGDAVLAIWPVSGDDTAPYLSALHAAEEAFSQLATLQSARTERGRIPVHFGIALHVGEVTYGNIGTEGRLDFTVIGRSVNEVSRVEGLCKTLAPLLLTEAFKRGCGCTDLIALGPHELRGVQEPVQLFTARSNTEICA